MSMGRSKSERGAVSGSLIAVILLAFALVMCIGLAIWLFMQYTDQKNNVDARIDSHVAEAVLKANEASDKKFAEREKEPNRQFVGPDDYGRLTFSYPKTWSLYVASDAAKGGTYEAYLNPVYVPPTTVSGQRFAARVEITDVDFDKTIARYDALVKKGDLSSSTVSANGQNGTRLDGSFTKDIRGSAVFFKLRDKTVSLYTDAETFKPDFNALVQTVGFNQ